MSEPHSPDEDGQAAAWIARLAAEDADEGDWLALEDWLAADPAHAAAYDRAERLWALLDQQKTAIAPRLAPDDEAPGIIDLTARRRRKSPLRWAAPAGGLAAAAALAMVVAPGLMSRPALYETQPGQTRDITLADGTAIHLNGGSRLKVSLGKGQRTVEMGMAEASFDVAHDTARPFVIKVGESQVRVVGTEFNIRRDADSTTVTVRRGIVEVRSDEAASQPVRLTPGMQLIDMDGAGRTNVKAVSPDAAFAWHAGQLVYTDEPLSEVAEDLSRHFAAPVRVEGDAANLPFSGVLVLDDESAVVRRLEGFLPIADRRADGAIVLAARR